MTSTVRTRLCVICARGGSKGLPKKNIKTLLGRPLISYSILQAQTSGLFSFIAVSSDSEEILEIAGNLGVDLLVKRPMELASDGAGKLVAIKHCTSEAENYADKTFDTIVDLGVTAPLRSAEDIAAAVNLLEKHRISNVLSGSKSSDSPYYNLVEIDSEGTLSVSKSSAGILLCRQEAPEAYTLNGSIYVWSRKSLFGSETVFNTDTMLYEMPRSRSIDIDSELDFEIAEMLARKRSDLCG